MVYYRLMTKHIVYAACFVHFLLRPNNLYYLAFLFYIIPLSGRHHKKEPLSQNGSAEGSFSGVCSFLYILDMTVFSLQVIEEMMHKKRTFYTYAYTAKCSIHGKLLF